MPAITRFLAIILMMGFSAGSLCSQQLDTSKLDNNPRLTHEESAWLNTHINRGEFDFEGKYVAFSLLLTGGFYGIGKFMLPLPKKNVFHEKTSEALYQLYVLSEEEKRATNGYDAIMVFGYKKHKGKMRRLKRATVIADHFNRYPQIPADAGKDDNPVLSTANADFFKEIYKDHSIVLQGFDFSGKKIAIFDTQCRMDRIEQQTIPAYVNMVKAFIKEYGYYSPEFTYVLNEEQKKESGGYDLIIQYRCKMDVPLQAIIKKLGGSAL